MPASSARSRRVSARSSAAWKASGRMAAGGERPGDPLRFRAARARARPGAVPARRGVGGALRPRHARFGPAAVPCASGRPSVAMPSAVQPRSAAMARCSGSGRGPRRGVGPGGGSCGGRTAAARTWPSAAVSDRRGRVRSGCSRRGEGGQQPHPAGADGERLLPQRDPVRIGGAGRRVRPARARSSPRRGCPALRGHPARAARRVPSLSAAFRLGHPAPWASDPFTRRRC